MKTWRHVDIDVDIDGRLQKVALLSKKKMLNIQYKSLMILTWNIQIVILTVMIKVTKYR